MTLQCESRNMDEEGKQRPIVENSDERIPSYMTEALSTTANTHLAFGQERASSHLISIVSKTYCYLKPGLADCTGRYTVLYGVHSQVWRPIASYRCTTEYSTAPHVKFMYTNMWRGCTLLYPAPQSRTKNCHPSPNKSDFANYFLTTSTELTLDSMWRR